MSFILLSILINSKQHHSYQQIDDHPYTFKQTNIEMNIFQNVSTIDNLGRPTQLARLDTDLEGVSMMVIGIYSGYASAGRVVGGRTRGTLSGKVSEATAEIRLDFPVPLSPATATRRLLRPPEDDFPPNPPSMIGETETMKRK